MTLGVRRWRLGWVLVGGVLLVVAAGFATYAGWALTPASGPSATPDPLTTTTVTRQDLVDYVTLDAGVGFGPAVPVEIKATGTITWLAPVGAEVTRGQQMVRVDDRPIVILYGDLPMYRALAFGAEGNDVEQLEQNLAALGYVGFTVDRQFTAATADAIRRWQRDLGVAENGVVEAGDVVIVPGPVRVAEHRVRLGAATPADAVTVTGTTRLVTATAPAADVAWAKPGTPVSVVTSDGTATPGTVSSVTTEGDPGAGNATTLLVISVEDETVLDTAVHGLRVRHAAAVREGVLTVPVAALLALAEGGYGLELVHDDGSTQIVAVQVGMFAEGRVEVSGAQIGEGAIVRMPR